MDTIPQMGALSSDTRIFFLQNEKIYLIESVSAHNWGYILTPKEMMEMGDKALEPGCASLAAAVFFSGVKEERGISERALMRGVGMTAKGRANRLLTGRARWTLDDVQAFATFLHIDLRTAFREIEKEMAVLSQTEEFPCVRDQIAS